MTSTVTRRPPAPTLTEERRPTPVKAWATLGAAFVVLNMIIYGGWIAEGDFRRVPIGPDPVPTSAKVGVWIFQVASVVLAAACVVFVIRQSRRLGRLSFDACVVIAWVLSSWQDPLANYIRPQFFYNAYFFNVGGWAPHIPGWVSPRGRNLPEDILGTAGVGYLWFAFVSILGCALLRSARQRWPDLGRVRLFLIALAVGGTIDFVVETICVHAHLWSYPGAIHALSLFPDTPEQFPLYESILWGSVWASVILLRFTVDDRGQSMVERGAHDLRIGQRTNGVVRALAVTAFVNVVFLAYSLAFVWVNLLPGTDTPDGYPSYLRAGLCGAGTPYPCPAQHVPIPVRGQAEGG